MRTPTIKDIARELQISVSTVSRALQNHPDISTKTKSIVRECARRVNYKPNLMASNLRTNKNNIIGVVIPELNHHFFSSVLDGIEQAANEAGYNILIFQTREDAQKEIQGICTLISSRVAGILMGVSKQTINLDHIQEVIDNDIPLVLYDRPCPSIKCDQVVSDDYMGAYSAVEHMICTGKKKIMYLSSSMQLEVSRRRYQGWRDALLHYDVPFSKDMVLECDTRAQAVMEMPKIFHMDNRPDAVFCVNDDCAVGVLHVAQTMGLDVPADVSICGFSDAPIGRSLSPMLTTVQQRGATIGKHAVLRLLKRLNGDELIPQTEMIATNLIVRETTI